jgi:hypothetical protein
MRHKQPPNLKGEKMSDTQKAALALMREKNLGAVVVRGFGYVWPTHIRNDGGRFGDENAERAAEAILARLAS